MEVSRVCVLWYAEAGSAEVRFTVQRVASFVPLPSGLLSDTGVHHVCTHVGERKKRKTGR